MSQAKAVVLKKNNNTITVLTREGAFQTLRYKRDVEVGEEILLPTQNKVPLWRIGASIAAVFLLTFVGIFGWNAFQPRAAVAMISLDINPSLQLTVDQMGDILELESLNSEAEQLAASLSLIGKPWGEALNKIIEESVAQNYFDEEQSWVVIGYSSVEPVKELPGETLNTEAISKQVQQAVKEQGLKPTLAVYELTPDQKNKAQETGLSLGEYALLDTAHKAGVEVKPEAIKEKEELTRLLGIPEIQKQMRTDKRLVETMSLFLEQDAKENNKINSQNITDMDKIKAKKDNNNKSNNNNINSNSSNSYKYSNWYSEKVKEGINWKKAVEQPQKDVEKSQGSFQDRDKNMDAHSNLKINGSDKVNKQGSNVEEKKNSNGNSDRDNNNKDNGNGKSEKIDRERGSKNQNKSNKEDRATESNRDNYQESWRDMDLRSILRMTYSQYN